MGELEIATSIISIIASSLSILVLIGGYIMYKKYIKEHVEKKFIDAYYGFYKILRMELGWLKDSLECNGNYALGNYLADNNSIGNTISPILQNKYEESRAAILKLLQTCENQMPLKENNDEFQSTLNLLLSEILNVYYFNAINNKIIASEAELKSITSNAKTYIENINKYININREYVP